MLVRRIARPLFAAVFVADGVGVLRRPEPHVVRAQAALDSLRGRADVPELEPAQVRTIVRAHGAATAVAGFMLATGRAPRVAGLVLAVLTLPLVAADRLAGDASAELARRTVIERLSMVGGALLAAADTEGRPGMSWRVQHARVDRAVAREARHAVSSASREAKQAARALRRVVD